MKKICKLLVGYQQYHLYILYYQMIAMCQPGLRYYRTDFSLQDKIDWRGDTYRNGKITSWHQSLTADIHSSHLMTKLSSVHMDWTQEDTTDTKIRQKNEELFHMFRPSILNGVVTAYLYSDKGIIDIASAIKRWLAHGSWVLGV